MGVYLVKKTKKTKTKKEIDVLSYHLVPKMEKVNEAEKNRILKKYGVSISQLPKLKINDPAVESLEAEVGDVIKIERQDKTGKYLTYKVVIGK